MAMLEGLRVVESSSDVAGGFAGRLFALLGADVVKVEPRDGDPSRWVSPRAGDGPDAGLLFAYLGSGKRSAVIENADQRRALALSADLVIEDGRSGLDATELLRLKPSIVVCSITPFGLDGPLSGWRATALTAFAAGGQMMLCGDPESMPLKTAGYQAYYQGGLHGFAASMTALYAARRTGLGDHLDISIQEAQAASLEGAGPNAMVRGVDSERTGNQARAVWGIYPSADGYVGVAAMARQTGSVYRTVGHPELEGDPAYTNLTADPTANDLVAAYITEWTTARTSAEVFEASRLFRAPFSLIPTPRELLEWPALREAGFWQDVEHPVLGRHPLPVSPFAIDGYRGTARRAPLLGEHTDEVLAGITDPATAPTERVSVPAPLLEGLRVLDLTQIWAGPYATRFLADMGADVIHIEGPRFPDGVRGVGRGDDPRSYNAAPYFNEYNRNKRGLALDLQRPEGMDAFRRLVTHADVVIENWSVGVAERLGLGYPELQRLNPRVTLVQMPGFGQTGAEAERVGFGPTIEQMGGLVALQGYEGGPPHKSGISYGDPTGGIAAAGATALALWRREQTGRGSHVVVTQRDNIIGLVGEYIVAEALECPLPLRIGNRDHDMAPHGVYRTRDDDGRVQADILGNPIGEYHDTWLAIAVDSDAAWQRLRSVIVDERLGRSEYDSAAGRRTREVEIDGVLAEWARDFDAWDAAARLQAAGVSAMPVLSPLMLVRDAHLEARGFFPRYVHPEAGEHATSRPVWRLARRPFSGVRPAPCFGEHNEEILRELGGYSPDEIRGLRESEVIADQPLSS
ncbi:MAG: CoA transferase [Dehalococcoidia bacterium]